MKDDLDFADVWDEITYWLFMAMWWETLRKT